MLRFLPSSVEAALREFQEYSLRRLDGSHSGQGKRLIQALADTIAEQFKVDPSDPTEGVLRALECFRIRCRVLARWKSRRAGELIPQTGGFLLTVFEHDTPQLPFDGLMTPATRRGWFTLGHELAHVAFYRLESMNGTPTRIVPRHFAAEAERKREEFLCEDFSRALLLPESAKLHVTEDGSVDELLSLWRGLNWQLPLRAVIRRIVYDWSKWPRSVFVLVGVEPMPVHLWGRELEPRSASLREQIAGALRALLGETRPSYRECAERLKSVAVNTCITDSGVLMALRERDILRLASASHDKRQK